jgi:hypothetical protein
MTMTDKQRQTMKTTMTNDDHNDDQDDDDDDDDDHDDDKAKEALSNIESNQAIQTKTKQATICHSEGLPS